MAQQLLDQTAVITGAGSGLGAAIARALAAEGARCVLAGRRPEPLERVAAGLGGRAVAVPADVSDAAQVEALVARSLAAFGRIDILVNNAGLFQMAAVEETTPELFDETLAVNLRGAFLCARAVWPHLVRQGGGQIVNVSSVAGVRGYPRNAAYCASKFGLNGLSEVLALEGREHAIRVFAVCPGSVDTPIWADQAPPDVMARMMKPEPIADLVRWLLASPRGLDFGPVVVTNFRDPWSPD